LWNNGYVERVRQAWRVGIRRVWGLPSNAHNCLFTFTSIHTNMY